MLAFIIVENDCIWPFLAKKYRTYTHESLVRDSYYLSHTSLLLEISFLYFWWSILHHEKLYVLALNSVENGRPCPFSAENTGCIPMDI